MKKVKIIIIPLLLIFIIYYVTVRYFFPNIAESGQFGDMFGGINAVFSGFAFLGVIYAIILQREDLELQRKELELTRQELKKSAEAQTKQVKQMEKSACLNALSALINFHATMATSFYRDQESTQGEARKAQPYIDEIKALLEK